MTTLSKVESGFRQLFNTQLVEKKEVTEETMAEFQQILNSTIPDFNTEAVTADKVEYKFFQSLQSSNTREFLRWLEKSDRFYLGLWTNAVNIVRIFQIQDLVYLTKNPINQTYTITIKKPNNKFNTNRTNYKGKNTHVPYHKNTNNSFQPRSVAIHQNESHDVRHLDESHDVRHLDESHEAANQSDESHDVRHLDESHDTANQSHDTAN